MLLNLKYYFLIFSFSFISTYVMFPLHINDKNFSSNDTPNDFINKIIDSDLYILINIGSKNTSVRAFLDIYSNELRIGGEGIKLSKYNESISDSYECIYCVNKEYYSGWYSEGVISTEDFYVLNSSNQYDLVHKMKFILGKKSIYINPPEGTCGLQLPLFNSEPDYNIINSLAKTGVINSYNWYLDYENFPYNNSKLIVDGFPHDLNNKKYNSENFISTQATSINEYINRYPLWALRFSDIYYNNISLNIDYYKKFAKIQFNIGIIVAPEQIVDILEKEFFEEYLNKNICFKVYLSINTYFYCKNTKEFDARKFKDLSFKNVELSIIFKLGYKELFYSKGDYIYFLIIFRKVDEWIFGEIFLKKYHLVFNQDLKSIGYYQDMENEDNNNNKSNGEDNNKGKDRNNFKLTLTNILLLLILLCIIIVSIVFYTKKGKRKNRANELDDDYEYKDSINEDKEAKEKNKIIE